MRSFAAVLPLLCAFLAIAVSPTPVHADQELLAMVEQLRDERRSIVEKSMGLTTGEGNAFWPVYDDYRARLGEIIDRRVQIILDFVEHPDTFSDEKSRSVLDELLELELSKVRLKRDFVEQFAASLPTRKVFKFYQIENKLDLLIQSELSSVIPLIK